MEYGRFYCCSYIERQRSRKSGVETVQVISHSFCHSVSLLIIIWLLAQKFINIHCVNNCLWLNYFDGAILTTISTSKKKDMTNSLFLFYFRFEMLLYHGNLWKSMVVWRAVVNRLGHLHRSASLSIFADAYNFPMRAIFSQPLATKSCQQGFCRCSSWATVLLFGAPICFNSLNATLSYVRLFFLHHLAESHIPSDTRKSFECKMTNARLMNINDFWFGWIKIGACRQHRKSTCFCTYT